MSEEAIKWIGDLTPDELAARIKAHPFAAVREPLMQKITLVALGHAQRATPVRTGTLRRSEINDVEPGGLRGFIGSNIVYAPFVHARVPFFEMGIDASQSEIAQLMEDSGDEYFASLVR